MVRAVEGLDEPRKITNRYQIFSPADISSLTAISSRGSDSLFNAVVGRFFGDDDVMHVRFAQARRSDPDKLTLLLKLLDGATARVAHPGSESTH